MGRIIGITASSILKNVDHAQLFIDATGITDTVQKNAIISLVSGLKTYGIWDKMKAIYPIVGGTAFTHKFNLKNAQDLNSSYRLTYVNIINHSLNGMVSDGTGYAITNLNAFTKLINNNISLSFYTRTNTTAGAYSSEISIDAIYAATNWITFRVNNKTIGNAYFSAGNDNVGATVSSTLGQGFFIGNEIANNDRKLYRNATQIATNSTVDNNNLPNNNINLFSSPASNKSTNECSFASIGSGLTAQNIIDFNTIVTNYQIALGRNV